MLGRGPPVRTSFDCVCYNQRVRGGKREGAGRRPIGDDPMQRVTVYLPRDYVDWARTEGGGNVAEGLRRLLEELDQRQGAERGASR